MGMQRIKALIGGMNQDSSVSQYVNQGMLTSSFYNLNARISATDDINRMNTVTNERNPDNNYYDNEVLEYFKGTIVGTCEFNDYFVAFTTDGDYDRIIVWRIKDDGEPTFYGSIKSTYGWNKFYQSGGSENKVTAIGHYENESTQNIYISDGISPLRKINLLNIKGAEDAYRTPSSTSSTNNIGAQLATITDALAVAKSYQGGSFYEGTVQFVITSVSDEDVESSILYISPLYYNAGASRPYSSSEHSDGCYYTLTLTDVKSLNKVKYFNIYSVYKETEAAEIDCRRLQITPTETSYTETGARYGDVAYKYSGTAVMDNTQNAYDFVDLLSTSTAEFTCNSIAQKDNTLFVGGFTFAKDLAITDTQISTIKAAMTTTAKADKIYCNDYISTLTSTGLTDYGNHYQLNQNSYQIGHFKNGETYRLGIQICGSDGVWSSVYSVGEHEFDKLPVYDSTNNNYTDYEFSSTIKSSLFGSDIIAVRPLINYVDKSKSKFIAQGLVNTTMTIYEGDKKTYLGNYLLRRLPYSKRTSPISKIGTFSDVINFQHDVSMHPVTREAAWSNQKFEFGIPMQLAHYNHNDAIRKGFARIFGSGEASTIAQPIPALNGNIIEMYFPEPDESDCKAASKISILGYAAGLVDYTTFNYSVTNQSIHSERANPTGAAFNVLAGIHQKWSSSKYKDYLVFPFQRNFIGQQDDESDGRTLDSEITYKKFNWATYSNKTGWFTAAQKEEFTTDYSLPNNATAGKYGDSSEYIGSDTIKNDVTETLKYQYYCFGTYTGYVKIDGVNVPTQQTYNEDDGLYYKQGTSERKGILDEIYQYYTDTPDDDVPYYTNSVQTKNPSSANIALNWKTSEKAYTKLDDNVVFGPFSRNVSYMQKILTAIGDDSFIIVDIKRNFDTIFDELSDTVEWNICGDTVPLSTGDTNVTIKWSNGDWYFQRYDAYVSAMEDPNSAKNGVSQQVSAAIESRINLCGINIGTLTHLNTDSPWNAPSEYNKRNTSYTYLPKNFTYYSTHLSANQNLGFTNSFCWSGQKVHGETVDTWTSMTGSNFYDLDGDLGAIVDIKTLGNTLICFQEGGISTINYNNQQQLLTDSGTSIEVKNSGTVNGITYITKKCGCSSKKAIAIAKSRIYFYDKRNKGLYSIDESGQLTDISSEFGMKSYFSSLDPKYKIQLMYSNLDERLFIEKLNPTECSSDDNSEYYIPSNVVNGFYTLVFNERLKAFESFIKWDNGFDQMQAIINVKGSNNVFANKYTSGTGRKATPDMGRMNFGPSCKSMVLDFIVGQDTCQNKQFDNVSFYGSQNFSGAPLNFIHRGDSATMSSQLQNVVNSGQWNHSNTKPSDSSTVDMPINRIRCYTDWQDTEHKSLNSSICKKKNNVWRIQIPRNATDKVGTVKQRIVNPWAHIELSRITSDSRLLECDTVINDIYVDYWEL